MMARAMALKFDDGFEADYFLAVNAGSDSDTYAVWVDYAEVDPAGIYYYVGKGFACDDGMLDEDAGGNNPYGIMCTLNNSNIAGVTGGSGAGNLPPQDPGAVTTGVEMAIPLEIIGVPNGDFKMCLFINGVSHDYLSNQVLQGIGYGDNLGEPRNVDFTTIGGAPAADDQFVVITNSNDCGACCYGDPLECIVTTAAECAGLGGTHFMGFTCDEISCGDPVGACCYDDESCQDLTEVACIADGGEWLGGESTCLTNPCTFGACCYDDGRAAACIDGIRQDECLDTYAGTWQGDGSSCDPNPCNSGACCVGAVCVDNVSEQICVYSGGTFLGDATICAVGSCGNSAGQPVVDGILDAGYGTALAVQDTKTEYGNNTDATIDTADGSELDAAYAMIIDDTLFLLVTGNLQSNYNKLYLWFDVRDGGQNVLRDDNPDNIDYGNMNNAAGLTFDVDFDADYHLNINNGNGNVYAKLRRAALLRSRLGR